MWFFGTWWFSALAGLGIRSRRTRSQIRIGYLRVPESTRLTISLLDVPPPDDGIAGAKLAIQDNNTTGKFLNQRFALEEAG